jgi:hypothetical protein
VKVEDHIAALHALWRADHEDYIAEIRGWAEEAEAKGWTDSARHHRDRLARLDALEKPWEPKRAT